jgi:hypothetical protein
MATKAITAWGETRVVEEVTLPQSAGDRRFASVVQLLEADGGARYVRFAYTTDGRARRGPVTLRAEDLKRLTESLAERPGLAAALGIACDGGARRRGGGRRKPAD